jgi:two-component system sensor histidine kinase/response regulator
VTQQCIRILLIDDDEDYFFITRDLLADVEGMTYNIAWIPDIRMAHRALTTHHYDVCLVDYQMGQETGLDFLRAAIQNGVKVPIILMTGQGGRKIDIEAMNLGAADYLSKDEISSALLERTIRYTIERARHVAQLREYAEDLETKNRELDTYTYTIAHDLTNPLSLVSGFIGLVRLKEKDNLGEESADMLKTVEDQALKMSDMVNQLLWLAQLRDASEVTALMEIEPIAKAALTRFLDRIENQNAKITIVPGMPMAVGQEIWVEEVFANLIGNALKYMGQHNTEPHITLCGYRQDEMAVFEVQDNGMGIAPEDQSRLFDMFTRVQNKQTRGIQGLGLGLSIVHRIVTKLGGEVGVRSTQHVGTTFWFTLPLQAERQPT